MKEAASAGLRDQINDRPPFSEFNRLHKICQKVAETEQYGQPRPSCMVQIISIEQHRCHL